MPGSGSARGLRGVTFSGIAEGVRALDPNQAYPVLERTHLKKHLGHSHDVQFV